MKKYLPVLTIAAAALLTTISLKSQNACFSPQTTFAANPAPVGTTTGDFNGDGKVDIATANQLGTISILLGNGSGSFAAPNNFAAGSQPYGIACGDFNGDLKLDLVITNLTMAAQISVFLGTGLGTFGPATNFNVGGQPRTVAIGDFNHDSNLDLVVASSVPAEISVLLGNGTGNFANAVNYATGAFPSSIAIGDFNNDLNPDIAVSNVTDGNVSVFIGNAIGGFAAAVNYPVGTSPYGVAIGDFNSDGQLDVCTANNQTNNVSILLGTGLGTFGMANNFPLANGSAPRCIEVGDFNADGKKDLAVSDFSGNNAAVLLSDGLGNFNTVNYFTVGSAANFLSIDDFDQDGKKDIVVCNQADANVSILLNAAPTVTYNAAVYDTTCSQDNAFILTGGNPAGGTYSGVGVNGGMFDPAVSGIGNFVINYSYNDINGCNGNAQQTIHVDICMGINSSVIETGMSVSPNPSDGNVTVELGSAKNENTELQVINSLGQIVKVDNYNLLTGNNKIELNLSGLAKGMYYIRVRTPTDVITKRIELN